MRFPLKLAIVNSGKTQRELARAVSIPETRVSQIVRGWVDPTLAERQALAAFLEQPVDVLFDDASVVEIRSAVR